MVGNRRLRHLRRCADPAGAGWSSSAVRPTGGCSVARTARSARSFSPPSSGQKLGTFVASENAADLDAVRELIEAGKWTPLVDRTYALSEVPAAIRHLLDGRAEGQDRGHARSVMVFSVGFRQLAAMPASARRWSGLGAMTLGVLAVVGLVIAFSLSSTLVKRADSPGALVAFWRMVTVTIIWNALLWSTGRRVTAANVRQVFQSGTPNYRNGFRRRFRRLAPCPRATSAGQPHRSSGAHPRSGSASLSSGSTSMKRCVRRRIVGDERLGSRSGFLCPVEPLAARDDGERPDATGATPTTCRARAIRPT